MVNVICPAGVIDRPPHICSSPRPHTLRSLLQMLDRKPIICGPSTTTCYRTIQLAAQRSQTLMEERP